ncbi:MAG TPA: SMC-Scp complex subunit ScpB [Edaphobacter sp.]|nr:SMC-Scp complex subunit ScpB [Edaphobacter sp.]
MSLKAKIEAVIYASEEPVTLSQLMGLLGQEAQAELDRIGQAQQALALEAAEAVDAESSDAASEETGFKAAEGEIQTDAEVPAQEASPAADVEDGPATSEEQAEIRSEVDTSEPLAATAEAAAEIDGADQRSTREAKEEKERNRKLREYFRSILDQLILEYANDSRGLEIREVANGYRMATKPEYHDAVRGFVKSLKPPLKLSLQALETLAVVAYKQPVTAPEVSEIRGVDSGGVLGSLMTRKLVTTAGRKQVIGRPILYKTTKDFLLRFGLKDINELPSIEEFEKMAGELAEQEEIQMEPTSEHHAPETPEELEPERHTHLPQADGSPDPVDDPLDDQLPDDEAETSEETAAVAPNQEEGRTLVGESSQ